MKTLSIIVPSYNVEKFLDVNLSKYINIPSNDLEVLIINDGSTDKTKDIALEYVNKYPTIFKLITKKNGGHGSTINVGIKEACGKYFKIVDADDWLDRDNLICLIKYLKSTDVDLIVNPYVKINKVTKKTKFCDRIHKSIEFNKEYNFEQIYNKAVIRLHSMTIKTEILKNNNIIIDENCYYVDVEYSLFPIPYIKKVIFFNDLLYYYQIGINNQSVNIKTLQRRVNEHLFVIKKLLQFYDSVKTDLECSKKNYIEKMIAKMCASQFKIFLSFKPSKNIKKQLINFDMMLSNNYKEVYMANTNLVVKVLRKTNYLLYSLGYYTLRIFERGL